MLFQHLILFLSINRKFVKDDIENIHTFFLIISQSFFLLEAGAGAGALAGTATATVVGVSGGGTVDAPGMVGGVLIARVLLLLLLFLWLWWQEELCALVGEGRCQGVHCQQFCPCGFLELIFF